MLYKVTPMLVPAPVEKKKARGGGEPRKRRKSAVFDSDGQEVLISLMCLKCKSVKPLGQFGLRRMPDGAIRNQPWCRPCRSAAGTKNKPENRPSEVTPSTVAPVLTPMAAQVSAEESAA